MPNSCPQSIILKGSDSVLSESGHIDQLLLDIDHVTEANRLLRLEMESLRMQTRILAHDLQSPVAAIYSLAEIIDDLEEGENIDEEIHQIKTSSSQALKEIEEFLSHSEEKTFFEWALVDVGKAISESIDSCAINAKLKNIYIEILDFPRDIRTRIYSVHYIVVHALANLLSNAIKYSEREGRVLISLSERGEYLRICVQDNGVGIPYSEQELVFSDSKCFSNEPSGGEKSTGLGLNMVHDLVSRIEGKIGFSSVPGQGSSFWIEFPVEENLIVSGV